MLANAQNFPTQALALSPASGGQDQPGRREQILTWIRSSPELPTPPAIALQIIDKASEPDCELNELADLINRELEAVYHLHAAVAPASRRAVASVAVG